MTRKGPKPIKMLAAAEWLSTKAELMRLADPDITYRRERGARWGDVNPAWRTIADAVRQAGFFSRNTGTIDVPVGD
jgi:hypothetical protein